MAEFNKIIIENKEYDVWANAQQVNALNQIGTEAMTSDLEYARKEMANAVTRKGVPTPIDSSLSTIADNINDIEQTQYLIEGDDMYERQMFGEPANEGSMWNFYYVLYDILGKSEYASYGSIYLAEYFKGYDAIPLSNADAYLTSDGAFYTENTTHTWDDEDDGRINRWVCYMFENEDSDYTVPNADVCPRAVYIGRHCGNLICTVAGRISKVVVPDGNSLKSCRFSSTQNWEQSVVIRNIDEHNGNYLIFNSTAVNFASIGIKEMTSTQSCISNCSNLSVVEFPELESVSITSGANPLVTAGNINTSILGTITFPKLKSIDGGMLLYNTGNNCEEMELPELETITDAGTSNTATCIMAVSAVFDKNYNKLKRISLPKLREIILTGVGQPIVRWYASGWWQSNLPVSEYYLPKLEICRNATSGALIGTPNDVLKTLDLPLLRECSSLLGGSYPSLETISMPSLTTMTVLSSTQQAGYLLSLKDLTVGSMTTNLDCTYWRPDNVFESKTDTLQLIYNIHHHIADNVSNRTGLSRLTFTFGGKAFLDASEDADIQSAWAACKQAFTNKNWTVA